MSMYSDHSDTTTEPRPVVRAYARGVGEGQRRRYTLQRGFTLLELIITLQIAALGSLIMVPKASAFFSQYQLVSAANQLGFDIARARMRAVAQHRHARIKMLTSTQYACETSTDGATWTNRETVNLPSRVTAAPTTGEVRFDKRGIGTVNDAITLSNGLGRSKTVTSNLVGRVTIGLGGRP